MALPRKIVPKYELLRAAHDILSGIPSEAISLDVVQTSQGDSPTCGTVCCGLGWLAHHPRFQSAGLTLHKGGLYVNGKPALWYHAAKEVFNIKASEAIMLFNSTLVERGRTVGPISDKDVLLDRIQQFLQTNDVTI